ncbi:uncharacterized protein BO95DRAFT_461805 [Aspergillus brunneoviolaceus CBS 621.78]|uniref:Uncharacterized protein n=1 Tax=Aspergillus brunneoviolaceus CBS 621.78 TaxID=1450534 RepID=A0ACD1GEM0_9EURO|nr:hypothetical protein BO95DRAFT_461805 [Aspergillus brunneoviolaceus CBS 621.78]RAH47739.1 hypothetical protein BO95DRAFT_461805 [Aspergillus brunneoviolaceus CBS 621.78]
MPTQSVTPASNPLSELDPAFAPDLSHLNDIFPGTSSSWATVEPASLGSFVLPEFLDTSTSEESMSIAPPSSNSPIDAGVVLGSGPSDLSGCLASACQALEAAFRKVIRDHPGQNAQDYPIGEIFNQFDGLLEVLALDSMVAITTSRTPQSPFDEYLRSKQASMAAQCYVLCIKLMAVLSEQVLQSLLALPLSAKPSASGNLGSSETMKNVNGLGAQEDNFSHTRQIPKSLRLGDLYAPPDPFGHALNSAINMLRIGSKLIARMEQLLGIPPELGGGSMPSGASPEQVGLDQPTLRDRSASKSSLSSLPARFVALIWEDEASMYNKSAVMYFRRCRAATLGLAKNRS